MCDFRPVSTCLDHALVAACGMTQILAEGGSGYRWGGQLDNLITNQGGALLFDVNGLLDFTSRCHSCSLLSTLMLFMDIEYPLAKQCSTTPVGLSMFRCSLCQATGNHQYMIKTCRSRSKRFYYHF